MTDVQYTMIRVLCEREQVFDVADKLARLLHLTAIVEHPQNSPNAHTQWVTVATSIPYAQASSSSADDFLAEFGITRLSAMAGVVAYDLAPLSREDLDGTVLRAVHKQLPQITGLRHFRYICADNYDKNYDMYLDPQQISRWPHPLRLMSDYILSDEFVSLALVLYGDVYQVKYEDQPIQQPEQEPTPYVDVSWANWKERKSGSGRPQPKDDMEEHLEWQSRRQTGEDDYSSQLGPHYQE